jgi:hypothetical protein
LLWTVLPDSVLAEDGGRATRNRIRSHQRRAFHRIRPFVIFVINHGSSEKTLAPALRDDARIVEIWRGTVDQAGQIRIDPLDGCLLRVLG